MTNSTETRITDAIQKAQNAFWARFAREFPEVTTGDLDIAATIGFDQAVENAAQRWLELNWEAAGSPTIPTMPERVVIEVVSIEPLPVGAPGSRHAVVRWSDGSVAEALRWYDDEVLFSEGDLLGKTEAQLSNLHFRRDRDYLRSDPGEDAED